MAFSKLADPRLVFKRLEFNEKGELLHYMIEMIGTVFSSLDLEHVYKKLMSDEEEVSSGLGNGVAVPHLFVDELDQTIIAIARIPGGIDFRAIDRKPVYLVCLILSDPNSYQNHLNLSALQYIWRLRDERIQ
jgi:PTS system fructose-specific IIC component